MSNKLYCDNQITKKDVDILSVFTNNCSPIFIIITVGFALLNSIKIGLLLLVSHFISSLIIGFVYSKIYTYIIHENGPNLKCKHKKDILITQKNSTFFDIVSKSITSAFKICLNMLGFMLFFNILSDILIYILEYLGITNKILLYNLSGIFEVVEGVKHLALNSSTSTYEILFNSIIYISILLGFSGISVVFQVKNELKDTTVKLKTIIISKILHGILSGIITYILLLSTSILNTEVLNVYSNIDINRADIIKMYNIYINSCAVILFTLSTWLVIRFNLKQKISLSKLLG